jgi:hypothetical protein
MVTELHAGPLLEELRLHLPRRAAIHRLQYLQGDTARMSSLSFTLRYGYRSHAAKIEQGVPDGVH